MKLKKALEQQKDSTEQVHKFIAGILGIPLNGRRQVEVQGRNSFLYVRLRNNQSEVIQAFNNQVSPAYNLPVLVERQGNRYVVTSVDTQRYGDNWTNFSPFLPRHGNTHSFDLESGGGGDIVWVQSRQITPLLAMPSGSDGGPNVIINPYTIKNSDGTWKYIGNTGTQNITPYNPSSPTGAIMVLVYADSVSGNPYLLVGSGTVFSNSITGTSQIPAYVPAVTNPAHIPLAAVRLITGSNALSWNNIYDVRQWLHTTPTGTGAGSVGPPGPAGSVGVMTWDEGVPVGTGTVFNFVGSNVHASISGSVVRVFVTGSSGGSVNAEDEGTPLGSPTTFNFVGGGVDASISGSVVRVHVTGSIPDAPQDGVLYGRVDGTWLSADIEVQEEGTFEESYLQKLNFVGDVDVSVSGSVVRVAIDNVPDDGPQGFGYNYAIRTTTISGTFNVALKTVSSSGNSDPSPTDKLIFRIGEDRREVTYAINFTMTSGTNWFNAGGTELTGQAIDFFVYVIWEDAASAVRLGMSRIPYALTMNDFVNTTTSEKYIRGNYSAFTTSDEVEVIGRVRTTKTGANGAWGSSGGMVFSKPLYETEWLTWNPAYSASASMTYTSVSTGFARYKLVWSTVSARVQAAGTIGGTPDVSVFATLPFESSLVGTSAAAWGYVNIDGLSAAGFAFMSAGTPDRIAGRRYDSANWTAGADRSLNLGSDYQLA